MLSIRDGMIFIDNTPEQPQYPTNKLKLDGVHVIGDRTGVTMIFLSASIVAVGEIEVGLELKHPNGSEFRMDFDDFLDVDQLSTVVIPIVRATENADYENGLADDLVEAINHISHQLVLKSEKDSSGIVEVIAELTLPDQILALRFELDEVSKLLGVA